MAPDDEDSNFDVSKNKHPLRVLQDVNGYSSVFMPGISPCFVLKSSSSEVKIIGLSAAKVQSLSSFNSIDCQRGIIYSDEDVSLLSLAIVPQANRARAMSVRLNFQ